MKLTATKIIQARIKAKAVAMLIKPDFFSITMLPRYTRKRRSKLEIYLEILTVISSGESKPTRIMTKTNMAWSQIQEEFAVLKERELIIVEDAVDYSRRRRADKRSKTRYRLTSKGEAVLRYFRKDATGLGDLIDVMHSSKAK